MKKLNFTPIRGGYRIRERGVWVTVKYYIAVYSHALAQSFTLFMKFWRPLKRGRGVLTPKPSRPGSAPAFDLEQKKNP